MKVRRCNKVIIILAITIVLILFWSILDCWLEYLQPYESGVEYYYDGSYSKFGFGLFRYGEIALEYLPKYEDVYENATEIDFVYSGGWGYTRTVDTWVALKYDKETYISKRDEILQMGVDFAEDGHIGQKEYRHHRLINKDRIINGDYVYYVVTCCDKENSIMYAVMFDKKEYTSMETLSIHSHPYYNFFRDFHTECIPSQNFE